LRIGVENRKEMVREGIGTRTNWGVEIAEKAAAAIFDLICLKNKKKNKSTFPVFCFVLI